MFRRIPHHSIAGFLLLVASALAGSVARAQQPSPPGALVTGVVYDSIGRRPIAGVTVQLASADAPGTGRPFVAVTDSSGRYSIAGVAPGR